MRNRRQQGQEGRQGKLLSPPPGSKAVACLHGFARNLGDLERMVDRRVSGHLLLWKDTRSEANPREGDAGIYASREVRSTHSSEEVG